MEIEMMLELEGVTKIVERVGVIVVELAVCSGWLNVLAVLVGVFSVAVSVSVSVSSVGEG